MSGRATHYEYFMISVKICPPKVSIIFIFFLKKAGFGVKKGATTTRLNDNNKESVEIVLRGRLICRAIAKSMQFDSNEQKTYCEIHFR